jgi:CheY-like chemotaxis protein
MGSRIELRTAACSRICTIPRRRVEPALEPTLDRTTLNDIQLVVSELVSNSVRHARRRPEDLVLVPGTVELRASHLVTPDTAPGERAAGLVHGAVRADRFSFDPFTPTWCEVRDGRCVLVVDDQPEIRRILELALQGEGFEVLTAASPDDGLDLVCSQSPAVVILDLMMRSRDGWSFLRELEALGGRRPTILILSARWGEAERLVARALGWRSTSPSRSRSITSRCLSAGSPNLRRKRATGRPDTRPGARSTPAAEMASTRQAVRNTRRPDGGPAEGLAPDTRKCSG